MSKLKERILKDSEKVYFDWHDSKAPSEGQSYGRAEFALCPIWKRGKIKELFIYHKQQRDIEFYYKIESGYADLLMIDSWVGLESPKTWAHIWCKEHKTQTILVYVPNNSNYFQITIGSGISINFGKDKQ